LIFTDQKIVSLIKDNSYLKLLSQWGTHLLNREQIFEEARRQGLIRSGFNFVYQKSGGYLNSAQLISSVRRLTENMTLEEAIKKLINDECCKGKENLS
jgi:hypothetical protein